MKPLSYKIINCSSVATKTMKNVQPPNYSIESSALYSKYVTIEGVFHIKLYNVTSKTILPKLINSLHYSNTLDTP